MNLVLCTVNVGSWCIACYILLIYNSLKAPAKWGNVTWLISCVDNKHVAYVEFVIEICSSKHKKFLFTLKTWMQFCSWIAIKSIKQNSEHLSKIWCHWPNTSQVLSLTSEMAFVSKLPLFSMLYKADLWIWLLCALYYSKLMN